MGVGAHWGSSAAAHVLSVCPLFFSQLNASVVSQANCLQVTLISKWKFLEGLVLNYCIFGLFPMPASSF